MATVVPSKSTGTFVRAGSRVFLEQLGLECLDVNAKSDREPATEATAHEVGQEKTHGRWIVEASPVGSSQSNGDVEREARSIALRITFTIILARGSRTIKEQLKRLRRLPPTPK